MDYGTIIIGLLSQALGLSLMILTGSVLLYLIIRGVIGVIRFLFRKIERNRKVKAKICGMDVVYDDRHNAGGR